MGFLDEPSGSTAIDVRVELDTSTDRPWQVLLFNDPVNLTDMVTRALQKVLLVDRITAENLMLTAHLEGRAAVFTGCRDKCETVAAGLRSYQLWTTMEKQP